jgi:hypothetical protein
MRTSSVPEPEISNLDTGAIREYRQTDFLTPADNQSSTGGTVAISTPLSAPSLSAYGSAYAATSRLLGRLNTTTVKKEEMEKLLVERQALLDKKFDGTMTRRDENRLEYVRWSLDRIQDAKSGRSLDALESMVAGYEGFLAEMRRFDSELKDAVQVHRERTKKTNKRIVKRRSYASQKEH